MLMKLLYLFLGISMSSVAFAQTYAEAQEGALKELRSKQEMAMEKFKKENKDWSKLPNDQYQAFYSQWANQNLQDELKLRQEYCEKDAKLCLDDRDKEALLAQTRVAVKVLELRNEYARSNPNKQEQAKVNKEIERAGNVSLCQTHKTNCDKLSERDLVLVGKLRSRDEYLRGMETEFGANHEDWQENKKDKEVKDFLIRRENKGLELTLKLHDDLCSEFPKDKDFCLDEAKIAELKLDSQKANCQHERIHQLYNITKDDLVDKEKILKAGHDAQWESLQVKDCKYLLAQDRMGESIAPAPVAAVASKEEVYGENEDEKNKNNFNASSCKWVTDIPRKISYLPGCGAKGACIGFVVCDRKEGGGKFVRTSICSPNLCGAGDANAVACTKQPGYYTKKPKDESKEFVSEKLKRIFSGAVKQ